MNVLYRSDLATAVHGDALDPFAGAGSTGVAALLEGRRVYLVELDEGYASTAAGRVAQAERALASLVGL
ncbi:MAG: DNA methyltransferase [Nitriliruptorales bacterium]